jgi:hypothetical protein
VQYINYPDVGLQFVDDVPASSLIDALVEPLFEIVTYRLVDPFCSLYDSAAVRFPFTARSCSLPVAVSYDLMAASNMSLLACPRGADSASLKQFLLAGDNPPRNSKTIAMLE